MQLSKSNPLVSIIIPTYNRAHLIGETLDSIIAQTYSNWECIVVDDGSTDTTTEILKEYLKKDSRIFYDKRPKDRLPGGNAARNYGFEISKGEYVNWFDDDDTMSINFISDKLDNNASYDIIISGGYLCDSNLNVIKEMKILETSDVFFDYIKWIDLQLITNSVMFKREFLLTKDLFNKNIIKGQEVEFFSRIFYLERSNKNFIIVKKSLFYHRNHLERKTSRDQNYLSAHQKSTLYIYIENYKRACKINNKELVALFHKRIIALYYRSISFKDVDTAKKIQKKYLFLMRGNLVKKAIFYVVMKFSLITLINSTKIRNILKSHY